MALISVRDLCWGFGDPQLLEKITFQIEKGQRICLLGRNGVGKSSLLKLLSGQLRPDSGEIWCQPGTAISALEQEVPVGQDGAIFDVMADGFGQKGRALAEYHRISQLPEATLTPERTSRRDELQRLLDAGNGWDIARKIENALSRTGLDPSLQFADLSAGMKRRVLFARAFAPEPDLLLLDEPTNHLDIDAIVWMEAFILKYVKTLLFITHDRAFLKRTANRIFELDRGRLSAYDCDYTTYLNRRQAALDAEEKQNGVFDKKLSQEEAWIRQGVKARRTRNEGRVRALKKLREAYQSRRRKIGDVRIQMQEAERSGKLVIEADSVGFSYGEVPLIHDFSTIIMRGDKVGVIGPNGIGKTTLLKILLKQIPPETGQVRHGTHLQVAYFDQLRGQLDEQKTVQENIVERSEFILFNGQERHVISYLRDFLFSPERCRTPVHVLSGGEKNRLLLAKLFTRAANVLVLDEPTNDLDLETLELLEELLFDYAGTLLMVSHDRDFINNVVTGTIAFEGEGRVAVYPGGYDDWLAQRPVPGKAPFPEEKVSKPSKPKPNRPQPRKLGYQEKKELETLPKTIETLEASQKDIFDAMSDPKFYKKEKTEITAVKQRSEELAIKIDAAYRRWEELEKIEKL